MRRKASLLVLIITLFMTSCTNYKEEAERLKNELETSESISNDYLRDVHSLEEEIEHYEYKIEELQEQITHYECIIDEFVSKYPKHKDFFFDEPEYDLEYFEFDIDDGPAGLPPID